MKDFKVGIVDYSVYLPEKTITAEELSPMVNIPANILRDKMGINKKYVGGPEDHSCAMALKATKDLIAKTGIDPNEIDMILYAGETYFEYICWTAGIVIQHEIGADRAYAWDLSYRCAGTPLALKVAKDMMFADETLKNVLICGGNTNCYLVDYKDPVQSFMFDMAPAAFAMLLRRDHDENLVLGSGIISDHNFCQDVLVTTGGSKNPLTQEMVEEMAKDPEKTRRFNLLTLPDSEGMKKRLGARSLPDFTGAVRLAAERSGIETTDIGFIGITHVAPKAHYAIVEDLGIDKEKTVYLSDFGHCGHADQLISLNLGREAGLVKDGTICALLGAGTGYAFTCSLIRWGK